MDSFHLFVRIVGTDYLENNEESEDRHDDDVEEGEEDTNEVNTSEEHCPVDTQTSNQRTPHDRYSLEQPDV